MSIISTKHLQKPFESSFGRYPRTLQQAFKGADYGAAIEVPCRKETMLKNFLGIFPKFVWGISVVGILGVLVGAVVGG
jgi:hypothetical protein